MPSTHYLYPGTTLSYLAGVEAAGVRSAAHSCWGDCNGYFNCPLAHLDGLLTCADHASNATAAPRAAFWVYEWYAAMTGGWLLECAANDTSPYRSADAIAAVLPSDGGRPGRIEVAVGFFGFPGDFAAVHGGVAVAGIPVAWRSSGVDVTVELVRFNRTGDAGAAVAAPAIVASRAVPVVRDGVLGVELDDAWGVRVQDALRITVSPMA